MQVTSVDSVDRKMNLTLVGESIASAGHVLHPKVSLFCGCFHVIVRIFQAKLCAES